MRLLLIFFLIVSLHADESMQQLEKMVKEIRSLRDNSSDLHVQNITLNNKIDTLREKNSDLEKKEEEFNKISLKLQAESKKNTQIILKYEERIVVLEKEITRLLKRKRKVKRIVKKVPYCVDDNPFPKLLKK